MPRNRTTFSTDAIATMTRMMKRGATALEIAKQLREDGFRTSATTVHRWLRDQRGPKRTTKAKKGASSPPSSGGPPAPIEPAKMETLDDALDYAKRNIARAELDGNVAAVSSMLLRILNVYEAKRKAERDKKPDPNDAPDYVAAAKRVRDRLHSYVEFVGSRAKGGGDG